MKIKLPLIIVNFKTYQGAVGDSAVKLAKACEKASKQSRVSVVVAVTNPDIYRVSQSVSIPVFSEHIDAIEYDAHTGHIVPENVRENGASGVLINHSEDRLRFKEIGNTIRRAKQAKLITVVCASTPKMVEKVRKFNPDFIAVEPPELIGGNISVSKAKPQLITKSIEKTGKIPLLCGAGIKEKNDVKLAYKLGARGILVASGVTKAKSPEKALKELADGFREL